MQLYKVSKDELYKFYEKEILLQNSPKYPLLTPESFQLLKFANSKKLQLELSNMEKHNIYNNYYLEHFSKTEPISYNFFITHKEKIKSLLEEAKNTSSKNKAYTIVTSLAVLTQRYYASPLQKKSELLGSKDDSFTYRELFDYGKINNINSKSTIEELENISLNPYIYKQVLLNSLDKKHNFIIDINLGDDESIPIHPVTERNSVAQILSLPFLDDEFIFIKTSSPEHIVKSSLPSSQPVDKKDVPDELFSFDNQLIINAEYFKAIKEKEMAEAILKDALRKEQSASQQVTNTVTQASKDEKEAEELAPQFLTDEELFSKFEYYLIHYSDQIIKHNIFYEVLNRAKKDGVFFQKTFQHITGHLDRIINSSIDDYSTKFDLNGTYNNIVKFIFNKNNMHFFNEENTEKFFKTLSPEHIFLLASHVPNNETFHSIEPHKSVKNRTLSHLTFYNSYLNKESQSFNDIFKNKFIEHINSHLDNIESFKFSDTSTFNKNIKQSMLWATVPYLRNKTLNNKKFYEILDISFSEKSKYLHTFYCLPPLLISNPELQDKISSHIINKPILSEHVSNQSNNFTFTFFQLEFENDFKTWRENPEKLTDTKIFSLPDYFYNFSENEPEFKSLFLNNEDTKNFLYHAYKIKHQSYVLPENESTERIKINNKKNNITKYFNIFNDILYKAYFSSAKKTFNLNHQDEALNDTYFKNINKADMIYFMKALSESNLHSRNQHNKNSFTYWSLGQTLIDYNTSNNIPNSHYDLEIISKFIKDDIKTIDGMSHFGKTINTGAFKSIFPLRNNNNMESFDFIFSHYIVKDTFYNFFANSEFILNSYNKDFSEKLADSYGEKMLAINYLETHLKTEDITSIFHRLTGNTQYGALFNIKNSKKISQIMTYLTSQTDLSDSMKDFKVLLNLLLNPSNSNSESNPQIEPEMLTNFLNFFNQDFLYLENVSNSIIHAYHRNKQQSNGINKNLDVALETLINRNNTLYEKMLLMKNNPTTYEEITLKRQRNLDNTIPLKQHKILKF